MIAKLAQINVVFLPRAKTLHSMYRKAANGLPTKKSKKNPFPTQNIKIPSTTQTIVYYGHKIK